MISELVEMTAAALAGIDETKVGGLSINFHVKSLDNFETMANRLLRMGYHDDFCIQAINNDYYAVWKFWPSSSDIYNALVIFSPYTEKLNLEYLHHRIIHGHGILANTA